MNIEGYEPALREALSRIGGIDLEERAAACGGRCSEDGRSVVLSFFGVDYRVILPGGEVVGSNGSVSVMTRLILLHHLVDSRGTAPSGDLITFREVPEGNFYYPSFRERVIAPFLAAFGRRPDDLRQRGEDLGWEPGDTGDISVGTRALPLVPICFVLWCGDDELEPEANMLFDSTVSDHLHTEDIALVAGEAMRILVGGET